MNNPFHMAEHMRRSATSLYWNVCSLDLRHSCGPFTSLLCPGPWGLLPPLLPVFHRVHLSITPQKWYMGRTFFETLLLWICFIPLTMGYYLGCVWTSRLKIIFRQNCGKCSIVDCGHLLHCGLWTFAPLPSGFTTPIKNLDVVLCVWSISFSLWKPFRIDFGGLVLWNSTMMGFLVGLFHSMLWIFRGPFNLETRVL